MEYTYLGLLEKLYENIQKDTSIPIGDRTKITETLASLQNLLWKYSA